MPRKSFVIALLGTLASLAQPPETKAPSKLTPAQAMQIRNLSALEFSPDGKRLAFVVREPVKGITAATHVWVMDVPGGEPRQWTTSLKSERRPHWSPDSRTLAFISDRDERAQVWLLHGDGGEAQKITDGKNAIDDFRWSPDGKQIALLASEPKSEDEEKKEKDKQDARVIDRDEKRARVWIVDVEPAEGDVRKPRQVTRGPWRVQELCWSPKGTLLVKATDHPESDEWKDAIYSLDLSDGKFSLVVKPAGPFGRMEASPTGAEFGYVASASGGPSEHDLFLRGLDGGDSKDLTSQRLDRPVHQFAFREDGSVVVSIENGVREELHAIHGTSAERMFADFPLQPTDFAVSRRGAVAMVAANSTTMPELWLSTGGSQPKQISHFNPSWRDIPLRPIEVVSYRSFDGTAVEATLIRPPGSQKGTKLPLVVLAHGGPTGAWTDRFNPWGQLLAARGYLVFSPNIRGSSGYGHKFIEMNRADWGGADFKDVMAGVDWLIQQGDADPDRLGIGGWSYGGYMAMWAITQTTRFRAAVAGAGMSDLATEFGTEQGSAYDEWFYSTPYENRDAFLKSSPITYIKNARTPTLILQGEADKTDPVSQSQILYRGLKRYGVKSDFVVYPREGHGIQEEKHALDVLERMLAWFDQYMLDQNKGGANTQSSVSSPR